MSSLKASVSNYEILPVYAIWELLIKTAGKLKFPYIFADNIVIIEINLADFYSLVQKILN